MSIDIVISAEHTAQDRTETTLTVTLSY